MPLAWCMCKESSWIRILMHPGQNTLALGLSTSCTLFTQMGNSQEGAKLFNAHTLESSSNKVRSHCERKEKKERTS